MSRLWVVGIVGLGLVLGSVAQAQERTVWRGQGWDAVVQGERVFVLEESFQHIRAVDTRTGKMAWRTLAQPEKPSGHHTIHLEAGRVYLYAGPHLVGLDPVSGKIKGKMKTAWNRRGCRFEARHGAGEISCEPASWFLDLEKMRKIGQFSKNEYHFYHDMGEPHDTSWARTKVSVIGRAGKLLIATIEDKNHKGPGLMDEKLLTVGLDWATGKPVWESKALIRETWSGAGVFEKGRAAWYIEPETRTVGVFDTQTGKPRWKKTDPRVGQKDLPPFFGVWRSKPGAIFVWMEGRAMLLDGKTGKSIWSVPMPKGVEAVPRGEDLTPLQYRYPAMKRTLRVLDPGTGKTLGEVAVEKHAQFISDGDRGFMVWGASSLRAFDPEGKPAGTWIQPTKDARPHMTERAVVWVAPDKARIFDRATGGLLGEIEGYWRFVGASEETLTMHRQPRSGDIGEVILWRLTP